jgi:putative ABC transport system permease protein
MQFLRLMFDNIRRNTIRSVLTALGTMVLVFVVVLVWSVLSFLDRATAEKSENLKIVVTERWRLPSQMPFAYASALKEGAAEKDDDVRPLDSMTWTFYGGSTEADPKLRTRDNTLFAFCLEPRKLLTMMDELDSLPPDRRKPFEEVVGRLEQNRRGIVVGKERLATMKKRIGDRFTIYGFNYKDIDLEVEIVGTFPDGRYDNSAALRSDYFNDALDAYPGKHQGKKHPLADKSLNLVWLRVPDREAFTQVAGQIVESPRFTSPSVKVETAASGISTFLDAYKDLIWGMRWLLAPAILLTMSLVVSNAISIGVRERRTEFAVLKVLGFKPRQILVLVLGEALLLGATAGLSSAGLTWFVVNRVLGGLKFPIAFFSAFLIPDAAVWWGLAVGAATAFAGSFFPAWSARTVRVSEVFARVA